MQYWSGTPTCSAVATCYPVCSQAIKWGQDEAEHSNFRLQLGHSKPGHIAKHGALPSVLTADAPEVAPAVPAWCSLDATPGPGAYEPHAADKDTAVVTVQRSAFGASGNGKASRYDVMLEMLLLAGCGPNFEHSKHKCSACNDMPELL